MSHLAVSDSRDHALPPPLCATITCTHGIEVAMTDQGKEMGFSRPAFLAGVPEELSLLAHSGLFSATLLNQGQQTRSTQHRGPGGRPAYHLGGVDSILELCQEIPHPAAVGPRIQEEPAQRGDRGNAPCEQPSSPELSGTIGERNGDILPHQDILYALCLLLCFLHLKALKFQIKRYNESSSRINSHSDLN